MVFLRRPRSTLFSQLLDINCQIYQNQAKQADFIISAKKSKLLLTSLRKRGIHVAFGVNTIGVDLSVTVRDFQDTEFART